MSSLTSLLPLANKVAKRMFSVVSVILYMEKEGVSHVHITHDTLDLTMQGKGTLMYRDSPSPTTNIGPHYTETPLAPPQT